MINTQTNSGLLVETCHVENDACVTCVASCCWYALSWCLKARFFAFHWPWFSTVRFFFPPLFVLRACKKQKVNKCRKLLLYFKVTFTFWILLQSANGQRVLYLVIFFTFNIHYCNSQT
jgi:hypothetical protein